MAGLTDFIFSDSLPCFIFYSMRKRWNRQLVLWTGWKLWGLPLHNPRSAAELRL